MLWPDVSSLVKMKSNKTSRDEAAEGWSCKSGTGKGVNFSGLRFPHL